MNLVRAEIWGLPVVSIASGEDVAEIRDVVYDGEAPRLMGFTLNKRGMLTVDRRELGTVTDVEFDTAAGTVVRVTAGHGSVEADRLHSLGPYALIVDEASRSTER